MTQEKWLLVLEIVKKVRISIWLGPWVPKWLTEILGAQIRVHSRMKKVSSFRETEKWVLPPQAQISVLVKEDTVV